MGSLQQCTDFVMVPSPFQMALCRSKVGHIWSHPGVGPNHSSKRTASPPLNSSVRLKEAHVHTKSSAFRLVTLGMCFVASSAHAADPCWIKHATQQRGGAKLVFLEGSENVPRIVTHSDGTHSKAVSSPDGSFILKEGDTVLLSEFLHSSCEVKVVRLNGASGLQLNGSICMPGSKCESFGNFAPFGRASPDVAGPNNSSKRTR